MKKWLDRLFSRRFFVSVASEARLQPAAAKLMRDDPQMLVAKDVFTEQAGTRVDFATLWTSICGPDALIPEIEFVADGWGLDVVTEDDDGRILLARHLQKYPIAHFLTKMYFAAHSFITREFGDDMSPTYKGLCANVLTVVRGFGTLIIHSLPDDLFFKAAPARWRLWYDKRPGLLSYDDIGYLLALVARRQGANRHAWVDTLGSDMKKKYLLAAEHFESNPPTLFDEGFDVTKTYDSDQIETMLNSGGVRQAAGLSWLIRHKLKSREISQSVAELLSSDNEEVVAYAAQALAVSTTTPSEAIPQIRSLLTHRSHVVVGCAFQSLKHLGDDPEYLERVREQLEKQNIHYQ